MSDCLTEIFWLPILGVGLIGVLTGTSILASLKNRISSLYFSRTTTLMIMFYCSSLVIFGLFAGSVIPLLWHIGVDNHSVSHHNIPILEAQHLAWHVCLDILTILALIVTIILLVMTFIVSQVFLHLFARKLVRNSDTAKSEFLKKRFLWLKDCTLNVIDNDSPIAFSFTLATGFGFGIKAEDQIVVTTGIIDLLNDHELEAVLAHEYSHAINHDTRYSHFIATFSTLMFFDPISRLLKKILLRNQEFKADLNAAERTQKPRSLARALYKLVAHNNQRRKTHVSLGVVGDNKTLIKERINRLLQYAKEHNLAL
jgi:Zn-dependent protease with chaperone function